MNKLDDILGEGYRKMHMGGDRRVAVAHVKAALADPALLAEARSELTRLATVVAARTAGARCGCVVSKTSLELLEAALAD